MIQIAKLSQIDQILEVTNACAKRMNEDGIFQWSATYPNFEVFKNDIKRRELYVFISETIPVGRPESIVGCIVISKKMDNEYKKIRWVTQTSKHYYIHRLAVHPDYQGKGIARSLMDFAEDLAIDNDIASIRLDTFSKNLRNQKFYEARGYKRLDSIFFPNQSEFAFYCYEFPLLK